MRQCTTLPRVVTFDLAGGRMHAEAGAEDAALARADVASHEEAGRAQVADVDRRRLRLDVLRIQRTLKRGAARLLSSIAQIIVRQAVEPMRHSTAKDACDRLAVPLQVDPRELVAVVPEVQNARAGNRGEAIGRWPCRSPLLAS